MTADRNVASHATFRPTRAEVDLGAIRHNCAALRSLLPPEARFMAVVKGDGYGHGDVQVARACIEAGADWLGVALVEEGLRLRDSGIVAPILVLSEAPRDAAGAIVGGGLVPTIETRDGLDAIEAATAGGEPHPVQVAVDTGMHREGAPPDSAQELARRASSSKAVGLGGVWTHLACADERDAASVDSQLRSFRSVLDELGVPPGLRHAANSAAAMSRADSHFDLVRCGIAVYGLYPARWLRDRCDLRPAMRITTRVASVRSVRAGEGVSYGHMWTAPRDTLIATVPMGYADGFWRLLSNAGEVLLGGVRRRVAGRVTMDQIMVDCGPGGAKAGDEVVLLGSQGAEEITAEEIADKVGTINYEVVATLGPRVPRVYT